MNYTDNNASPGKTNNYEVTFTSHDNDGGNYASPDSNKFSERENLPIT